MRVRAFFASVVLAATAVAIADIVAGGGARAAERGLAIAGRLPWAIDNTGEPAPPGLLVDSATHRGYALDLLDRKLLVYDLVSLRHIESVRVPDTFNNTTRPFAAVDERHHRLFFTGHVQANVGCAPTPLWVFDTRSSRWAAKSIPCLDGGRDAFVANGMSYDRVTNKLHFVGYAGAVHWAYQFDSLLAAVPGIREQTLFRQVDADTLQEDWLVDASAVCDWHQTARGTTVARAGNRVIGYCNQGGNNQNGGAARGVVLTIPLDAQGRPRSNQADAVETAPAYQDSSVGRIVDPGTGRMMLISENLPFGPAVWVYDTGRHNFVGVAPTGVTRDEANGILFVGLDSAAGRLYIRSVRGFVVLDARHSPLPGGVAYPVLPAPRQPPVGYVHMPIDTGLRRIFVLNKPARAWDVVDDHVPSPPPAPEEDPDEGTADIPEQEGVTGRSATGGATAFGMHMLNVGGVPTALQRATDRGDCAIRLVDPGQRCWSEVAVAPGQREAFLASTDARMGSRSGVAGWATSGGTSGRDFATDSDVRALGGCYADRVGMLSADAGRGVAAVCPPSSPAPPSGSALEGVTLQNMRRGTQGGNEGRGFPVPTTRCVEFEDADEETAGSDQHASWLGTSATQCDGRRSVVAGHATAAGATIGANAGGAVPLLEVARSSSAVRSELTRDGQVTHASAAAEGVRLLGAVTIDRVETEAVTRAAGRRGTTRAAFKRTFWGVHAPGYDCAGPCPPAEVQRVIDDFLQRQRFQCEERERVQHCMPGQAAAAAGRAFGTQLSVRIPPFEAVATPRGYTGLVAKDHSLAVSDRAINGNEVPHATGLDVIVVNDYSLGLGVDRQQAAGRSRLIVELAGVQAESHYGIYRLPTSSPTVDLVGGADGTVGGDAAWVGAVDLLGSVPSGGFVAGGFVPMRDAAATGPIDQGGRLLPMGELIDAVIRLFVNSPVQAALLALLLGLFALPVYLGARRRALVASLRRA